jgi:beta-galactosidase
MGLIFRLTLLVVALVFAHPAFAGDVQNFNSGWRFSLSADTLACQPRYNDADWRILDLPHDWSIESDFSLKYPSTPGSGALPGGIGWYRKTFTLNRSANKNYYIDFDGIYWNSKVWLNGHFLGHRPNGYISFRYDLTPYLNASGKNVIAVQVNNSQQPNSRWYTGSGIYRNVWLTTTGKVQIAHWGTYVTTPKISDSNALVEVETSIENTNGQVGKFELKTIITNAKGIKAGETTAPISFALGKNQTVKQKISISKPILWSVEKPYLYQVTNIVLQNGKPIDQQNTSLGIRFFHFDAEKGFFLNGKPLKIKGVCMHHDLGCLGTAVNIRAIERQLEILKQMGCNAIRTSHNAPAPELLDLCDRMGFIVMDEALDIWRKKKSPFDYSNYFNEWHERDLTDLILRDRNHPSVFLWSIGNEVLEQWSNINADTLNLQQANLILNFANTLNKKDLDTTSLHVNSLLTIKLANTVRDLDKTRPVTAGNNEPEPSNHVLRSGAMDIVGFNYHEYNWGDAFHKKFPNQKLIITESTSALMSRGYYEMPSDSIRMWPKRWDIPFDRPVHHCSSYDNCHVPWGSTHEESWNLVKKYDHISGLFLWTGFDYLGEPTPFWWPSRSSYFGVVDLAGFPKDAFYMYQSEWADKPVLHIFPHWNWEAGKTVDVWAYYSQAEEVELFLNGKSLEKKQKQGDTLHVMWRVPFEAGTLKAVSSKNGKVVLAQEIQTAGDPVAIRLKADRNNLKADGQDLSFVTAEVVDSKGIAVPTANNLLRFSVVGEGFIAGTDNGDPTDSSSLKKPERHLFSGKALVVIQTKKKIGKIRLKVSSNGLKDAILELNLH